MLCLLMTLSIFLAHECWTMGESTKSILKMHAANLKVKPTLKKL